MKNNLLSMHKNIPRWVMYPEIHPFQPRAHPDGSDASNAPIEDLSKCDYSRQNHLTHTSPCLFGCPSTEIAYVSSVFGWPTRHTRRADLKTPFNLSDFTIPFFFVLRVIISDLNRAWCYIQTSRILQAPDFFFYHRYNAKRMDQCMSCSAFFLILVRFPL